MSTKYILISIIASLFFMSYNPSIAKYHICMYGIDSLTNGADGKSFRISFDITYKNNYENSEPRFIHIDYATSKDLNIDYKKSSGLINMASEDYYSIDPIKSSVS